MKRLSLIVALIVSAVVVLSACDDKKQVETESMVETQTIATEQGQDAKGDQGQEQPDADVQTEAAVVEIENFKPVSLYYMDYVDSKAVLITSYATTWSDDHDIAYFGAFASSDSEIPFERDGEKFQELWNRAETLTEYKIGYEISFTANDVNYLVTIRQPVDIDNSGLLFSGDVDTEEVTGFVGVWMYDDIAHIGDGFYSHVTQDEYTDETLFTSIKLRLTPRYAEVSNLQLTAFSYSCEDEFDADGHYCGNYGYTINIVEE